MIGQPDQEEMKGALQEAQGKVAWAHARLLTCLA
jgi:hypothetical protein